MSLRGFPKGSRGNLFFLKKKMRETYHLKKKIATPDRRWRSGSQ